MLLACASRLKATTSVWPPSTFWKVSTCSCWRGSPSYARLPPRGRRSPGGTLLRWILLSSHFQILLQHRLHALFDSRYVRSLSLRSLASPKAAQISLGTLVAATNILEHIRLFGSRLLAACFPAWAVAASERETPAQTLRLPNTCRPTILDLSAQIFKPKLLDSSAHSAPTTRSQSQLILRSSTSGHMFVFWLVDLATLALTKSRPPARVFPHSGGSENTSLFLEPFIHTGARHKRLNLALSFHVIYYANYLLLKPAGKALDETGPEPEFMQTWSVHSLLFCAVSSELVLALG